MKGQVVAIALVMAIGLMVMIMARSLLRSLTVTRDTYYADHRFAELFADLKRAPNSLRARLAALPGVATVETRVRGGAVLDLPGMLEPAEAVLVSLPDDRPQQFHHLFLRTGRMPA